MKVNAKLSVLLITCLMLFSCSSRDIENDADENSKVEFLNKLENFNVNYQLNVIDKQEKSSSRFKKKCGWWCKLGNAAVIAGADIVGAGAGAASVQVIAAGVGAATAGTGYAIVTGAAAIISGAGASIAAADAQTQSDEDHTDEGNDGKLAEKSSKTFGKKMIIENLNIEYPSRFYNLKNIGKLHNEEVNNFYNNKKSKLAKTKGNDILDSEEFIKINYEIKNSIKKYVSNDFNIDELTSELLRKKLISENMSLVFDKFFRIYNNSKKGKNIQDIVNFYINSIANTDVLSNSDKAALISSFSVASESPFYWINQN